MQSTHKPSRKLSKHYSDSHKTPKRHYAEELCFKHRPDGPEPLGDRPLANLLYNSKFKKDFTDWEHARATIRQIRGHLGNRERKLIFDKSFLVEPNYSKTYVQTKDSEEYNSASKRKLTKAKYYIITWAQNNTDVHEALWENILAYTAHLGASLHVILGRYKNPTKQSDNDPNEHWDEKVVPFADANRHNIHKNLVLLSDVKIQIPPIKLNV